MSSAEEMARAYAAGDADVGEDVQFGGSGKNRTKQEQHEHKKEHPEGDTRRIVENIKHGEDKRKQDELKKTTSKDNK